MHYNIGHLDPGLRLSAFYVGIYRTYAYTEAPEYYVEYRELGRVCVEDLEALVKRCIRGGNCEKT